MNKITVVGGMGHIGLPLGILLADKDFEVNLLDSNLSNASRVLSGDMPYVEHDIEPILQAVLKNQKLNITDSYEVLRDSEVVIVCIGTPVDEYMAPIIDGFMDCINKISLYAPKDAHVVIRSSIFPGCFEQIDKKLRNKGFSCISYCPERIVQGYAVREISSLPQIISAYDPISIQKASDLFKVLTKQIITATPKEAELAKLFSNSWRYLQFAATNQFSMIAAQYGVEYENVRNIMRSGYDRNKNLPSEGFAAGPCLLKDTYQLFSFYGNQFQLGQAAININEGYPQFFVDHFLSKFDLSKKTVGILGMAFKPSVDDCRDSLSFRLKKILIFKGATVLCSDQFSSRDGWFEAEDLIDKSDILIVATPHPQYDKLNFYNKPVFHVSPGR